MTDNEAAEFYRDKLVDWMINQDIPTGHGEQGFEDILEVLAAHIRNLQERAKNEE
jgi:hypothetical protein